MVCYGCYRSCKQSIIFDILFFKVSQCVDNQISRCNYFMLTFTIVFLIVSIPEMPLADNATLMASTGITSQDSHAWWFQPFLNRHVTKPIIYTAKFSPKRRYKGVFRDSFHCACAETPRILLPVSKWTSDSEPACRKTYM